jgi:hypothetical protein
MVCAHIPAKKSTHCTVFDHKKEWPLAWHACDSNAPYFMFGNFAVEVNAPITRNEVPTLIQDQPKLAAAQPRNRATNFYNQGSKQMSALTSSKVPILVSDAMRAIVSEISAHLTSLVGVPRHQLQALQLQERRAPTCGWPLIQWKHTLVSLEAPFPMAVVMPLQAQMPCFPCPRPFGVDQHRDPANAQSE